MECFRLKPKEDLYIGIQQYCQTHNIIAAALVSCAGCVSEVSFRMADGETSYHEVVNCEIVSLSGTIAKNGMHLHISFCDQSLRTFGGHLTSGCIINTTAELVLVKLDEYNLERVFDPQTGYDELKVERL